MKQGSTGTVIRRNPKSLTVRFRDGIATVPHGSYRRSTDADKDGVIGTPADTGQLANVVHTPLKRYLANGEQITARRDGPGDREVTLTLKRIDGTTYESVRQRNEYITTYANQPVQETGSRRVRASAIPNGSVLGNGDVVLRSYRDSQTPRGRVTVEVRRKDGTLYRDHWNMGTMVSIRDGGAVTSDVAQPPETLYDSSPSRTGRGNGRSGSRDAGRTGAGREVPAPGTRRVDRPADQGRAGQRPVVNGRELAIVGGGPVRKHKNTRAIRRDGGSTPPLFELDASREAAAYRAAMQRIKNSRQGASVTLYETEDYAKMRLFMNATGTAGFALNGDELVSVWSLPENPDKRIGRHLTATAVSQGARRLDAFDTVLPHLYALEGFVPVARVPFNDEYAPDGWDYEFYKTYNAGRPDVVFMAYSQDAVGEPYDPHGGRLIDDYDEGAKYQRRFLRASGR